MIRISNQQARQFLLLKHGLLGEYTYEDKNGILEYIRRIGCIQFDPVDVCGRNVDILLNSRVKGYSKRLLSELLYTDRKLVDYFDKNLSILPIEDFPIMLNMRVSGGYAEAYDRRGGEAVRHMEPIVRKLIKEKGYISASEVGVEETIEWHWGVMTSLQRAALESMYFRGELIVHHKNGTNKSYAFMEDYIPKDILNKELPFATNEERIAWFVKRRIGAVGMLWNKASDAWLGMKLNAKERTDAFSYLQQNHMITPIEVEGLSSIMYINSEDLLILEGVLSNKEFTPRTELIAPLDNFMWDRKLIKALFGFEYKWEIYTPIVNRKYGAYVLPILYGEQFIGRLEAVRNSKNRELQIKNIWYEEDTDISKKMKVNLDKCLKRFALLNDCEIVTYI